MKLAAFSGDQRSTAACQLPESQMLWGGSSLSWAGIGSSKSFSSTAPLFRRPSVGVGLVREILDVLESESAFDAEVTVGDAVVRG
jgi:hypothetical protein